MTILRITCTLLAFLWGCVCAGQSPEVSYADLEGLPIEEIKVPLWAEGVRLPIQVGEPLSVQKVSEAEAILRRYLERVVPIYPFPATLDASLFATRVEKSTSGGVIVNFNIKRLILTEDDTPGRAIDEASNWNPAYHVFEGIVGYQADRRFEMIQGGLISPHLQLPFGLVIRPSIEAKSQPLEVTTKTLSIPITLPGGRIVVIHPKIPAFSSGPYDVRARMPVTTASPRLVCEPQADWSNLPFADGKLLNLSIGAGCGYRFHKSGATGWRMAARYRFAKQKLAFDGIANRHYVEQGFQAELSREYFMSGGFVRVVPWADASHSQVVPFGLRLGALARMYREWTPHRAKTIITDIVASGGASLGPVSTNRALNGGSPFDPVLLEQPLNSEDYSRMGPILRGYGFSDFHAPLPPTLLTREGTSFSGVSLTVGLPGWAILLFDEKTPEYKHELRELADQLTDNTRARALLDYLRTESDVGKAHNLAQKRVNATKLIVHSLFEHAKRVSVRPLIIVDYGSIMSRDAPTIQDWSAGVGARIWFRLGIIESLYSWNGSGVPGVPGSNRIIRFSLRGSPTHPYPF